MGYTTKTFRPSVINGRVANVINSDASDKAFADGDTLFDWHELIIPNRSNAIVNAVIHAYGNDGGAQSNSDIALIIAKSNNGAAPTSLGNGNVKASAAFDLPDLLMNVIKFEGSSNAVGKLNMANLGSTYYYMIGGGSIGGNNLPVVINPEPNRVDGTTKIYVAGIAHGSLNFSTGVLSNASVSDDSATSIVTKTVDPRRHFRVGDTVYIHDVDTAIGTIASLTNDDIVLTSNNVGAIAADDEFLNDKPLTITLAFSDGKI
jgi:hypothetical protein